VSIPKMHEIEQGRCPDCPKRTETGTTLECLTHGHILRQGQGQAPSKEAGPGWALLGERVVWLSTDGTLYVSRGVAEPRGVEDMASCSDLVVGPYGEVKKNAWGR